MEVRLRLGCSGSSGQSIVPGRRPREAREAWQAWEAWEAWQAWQAWEWRWPRRQTPSLPRFDCAGNSKEGAIGPQQARAEPEGGRRWTGSCVADAARPARRARRYVLSSVIYALQPPRRKSESPPEGVAASRRQSRVCQRLQIVLQMEARS